MLVIRAPLRAHAHAGQAQQAGAVLHALREDDAEEVR